MRDPVERKEVTGGLPADPGPPSLASQGWAPCGLEGVWHCL